MCCRQWLKWTATKTFVCYVQSFVHNNWAMGRLLLTSTGAWNGQLSPGVKGSIKCSSRHSLRTSQTLVMERRNCMPSSTDAEATIQSQASVVHSPINQNRMHIQHSLSISCVSPCPMWDRAEEYAWRDTKCKTGLWMEVCLVSIPRMTRYISIL